MQEPNTQPAASEPTVTSTPKKGLSSAEILSRVSAAVVTAAPRALASVIDTMVARELEKRAAAILGGVELFTMTRSSLKKAQEPDIRPAAFSIDGKAIGEPGWSKPRLAEIKKLTEKLVKIEKAIDLATRDENPEFGQLYGLKADLEKAEKAAASEAQGTDA